MKIIDLLNKISKGEEVPKKIKYEDDIYIHIGEYCYYCDDTNLILSDRMFAEQKKLNENIEIIEKVEEDEFEDITTINICPKDDAYFIDTLNDLIKNQKKIINELKNK